MLKEVQKKIKQIETESESEVCDLSNEEHGPYLPMPEKGEVGQVGQILPVIPGRDGFFCSISEAGYNDPGNLVDEDQWIFCPLCCVRSHASCLRTRKCICGFKPNKKDIIIFD